MRKTYILLAVIVVIGALLRVAVLDRGDVISDEALYGFRAVGMLDFDFALYQPTPLQMVNGAIPDWMRFSFHDHPPLVFAVQHLSMGMFGVNAWGLRLPSALFGIGALILIYLIAKKFRSERAGLIAVSFAAVNVLLLYASRTGVQESQVIFFILLTAYCWIRGYERAQWFLYAGIALGLGLLSKYTAGIILLPLLLHAVLYHRTVFSRWQMYGGAAAGLILFSPVIIYNAMLFRTLGHFDFQLSYLFGQNVSYWQVQPGKEIGSLSGRATGIFINLWQYHSRLMNLLAGGSLFGLLYQWARKKQISEGTAFVLLVLGFHVLLYLVIGPSPRFLTLIIPWLLIAAAFGVENILSRSNLFRFAVVAVFAVCAIEAAFSYNSYIRAEPFGKAGLTFSPIHWDMHPWGYQELDRFLDERLAGRYSALIIPYSYPFLEEIREGAITRAESLGYEPMKTLFIYDDSLNGLGALWTIQRRGLYEAWPMISAENYLETTASDAQFYSRGGFEEFVFIRAGETLLREPGRSDAAAKQVEDDVVSAGSIPETIHNASGETAFSVYRFE